MLSVVGSFSAALINLHRLSTVCEMKTASLPLKIGVQICQHTFDINKFYLIFESCLLFSSLDKLTIASSVTSKSHCLIFWHRVQVLFFHFFAFFSLPMLVPSLEQFPLIN